MSDRVGRLMMSVALAGTSWIASHVDPDLGYWPALFVVQTWLSAASAVMQAIMILADYLSGKPIGERK